MHLGTNWAKGDFENPLDVDQTLERIKMGVENLRM